MSQTPSTAVGPARGAIRRAFVALLAVATIMTGSSAVAAQDASTGATSSPPQAQSGGVLATSVPDAGGVAILRSAAPGAPFVRIATLYVAGWGTQEWESYDCLTGDGKYLAVTFAPRAFSNKPDLRDHGAFGGLVELATGDVWILPRRVALHYYNPGCGTGSQVTWTSQRNGDTAPVVDVITADASMRKIIDERTTSDIASPVMLTSGDVVAADGSQLVQVRPNGSTKVLYTAPGPVFDLHPAAGGGLDFLVWTKPQVQIMRLESQRVTRVGTGPQSTDLRQGLGGSNIAAATEPLSTTELTAVLVDGALAAVASDGSRVTASNIDAQPSATVPVTDTTTGAITSVPVATASEMTAGPAGATASSARTGPVLAAAPPSTSPCSVAPLDPGTQIIQPNPAQVEWAAHKAVRGELTTARPANWQKHGLPAYTPQSVFPMPTLTDRPSGRVPVQLLMGVLAQESNFKHASSVALPGVATDPLIGNFYGVVYDSQGFIVGADSAKADCGYGVGQITTNMRKDSTAWSSEKKRQVATDYQVNVAASVSFLMNNWNILKAHGMLPNDEDPSKIENWYLVLWMYNTGFYYPNGTAPWGVGWTNNPIQNDYPPTRSRFLEASYEDAKTPSKWPYQERVLGWAEYPQQDFQTGGFKYQGTTTGITIAPFSTFCQRTTNNCDPASVSTGYCLSTDRKQCWYHGRAVWLPNAQNANGTFERYRSDLATSEPSVANPYPPACAASSSPVRQSPGVTALPAGAVIVDDLPTSASNIAGCAGTFTSAGTFTLDYGTDAAGNPAAAIDTHQLSAGFMGHSYFARSVSANRDHVVVKGTWDPPSSVTGWQRIWVHLPDNGADSHQAQYTIRTGTKTYTRTINQRWNALTWFDLGSFLLTPTATVELTNATYNDFDVKKLGAVDVSWDAIAFTPSSKPTLSYVAFGDSYQAGEGIEPYFSNSDVGKASKRRNACHRSSQAYGPLVYADLGALRTGAKHFHFPACSGAVLKDVAGTGAHFYEAPQLEQGWLDENTTHVSIGIGGNDARFADIIKGCIITLNSCTEPDYKLTREVDDEKVVDPEPLITYEPKVIDALAEPLRNTYAAIRAKAPNAKLLVVGYPRVIALSNRRPMTTGCSQLSQENIEFFSEMGLRLNNVIRNAAATVGATYVDPVQLFEGPPSHEACAFDTSVEWINAIVTFAQSGSSSGPGGKDVPGPGSFHPKASGHSALRNLIRLSWT